MKRATLHRFRQEQAGSGLLGTLMLVTVLSILISSVLAVHLVQYRLIRRQTHRVQARYAAEAGVYLAIDRLQHSPYWRATDTLLALPEGQASRVTVEAFGGYVLIFSEAQYRRSRAAVRARVGEIPPPYFDHAVQLQDGSAGLHLAGTTRITGTIVVGRRGVKTSTFKRERFTGRIQGAVFRVPDLEPPYFDNVMLEQAMEGAEQHLHGTAERSIRAAYLPLARRLPGDNPVLFTTGDLRLGDVDSLLLREPVTVVAGGNLVLEGPIRLQPGTMLIAGKTLRVRQSVAGRGGLFYGREGIEVTAGATVSGQFFSQQHIRIAGNAYVGYPSLLYVAGEEVAPGGGIVVEEGAVVDGTIIYPPMDPEPAGRRGRIRIQSGAYVRGAIFNAHETEFHGTLYGTLLTRSFYFYDAPARYVNWVKDAVIDVEERPVSYRLPLCFSTAPRLDVLNWEIIVEEVEGSDPDLGSGST